MLALRSKALNPGDDPVASDLWAIGITVLSAATNTDFNYYYDWVNYRVRYDRIKRMFDVLASYRYSDSLLTVINEMIEETENRRIKLNEIKFVLDEIGIITSQQQEYDRNSILFSHVKERPEEYK